MPSTNRIDRFWPGFVLGGVAGIVVGVISTKKLTVAFADEYTRHKWEQLQQKVSSRMAPVAEKAAHLKDEVVPLAHKLGQNLAAGADKFRKGARQVGELVSHRGEELSSQRNENAEKKRSMRLADTK